MAALSRRGQVAFVALFALYACIVIPLGVRKGDDVMAEITPLWFLTFHNDTIGALVGLGLLLVQRTARIRLAIPVPSATGSPQPV